MIAASLQRCSTNDRRFVGAYALGYCRLDRRDGFRPHSRPMLAVVIMAAPCVSSSALDEGKLAPCDGVLISAKRARQAIADQKELELRKTFECAPCPPCQEPKKDDAFSVATASFFSGFVLGLLLFLVR